MIKNQTLIIRKNKPFNAYINAYTSIRRKKWKTQIKTATKTRTKPIKHLPEPIKHLPTQINPRKTKRTADHLRTTAVLQNKTAADLYRPVPLMKEQGDTLF